MSVPSTAGLAQSSAYVCRSCQSKLVALRNVRFTKPRAISTASFTRRTPQPTPPAWRTTVSYPRPNGVATTIALRSNGIRAYSTSTNTLQPTDSGIAPLPHRRLISLSGPDTVKLLQGLITNNVHAGRNQPFFAAFLDSRGRVLWDVFVWVYPELLARNDEWSCYIEVDAAEAGALVKHLKRHKLRSKVAIELVPEEELEVWAAWGQAYTGVNKQLVEVDMCDPRGDATLWRILAKPGSTFFGDRSDVQDEWQYHLQRYRQGIAEGPQEIPRESALPMEVNIDLSEGIDFKKGCYLGQELTIRTKHTGVVRKRMLPVQLDFSGGPSSSALRPEPGTDIKQLDEVGAIKKGRAAGKFVANIGDIGLAMCRLEMMTPMRISAEGGSYKDGMEFGVSVGESGHVVRVKPVLHEWFQEKERTLWAKSKPKINMHTED
ncbi:ccr4 associated factor [Curvularia kusanoi]|uniref:Iron-sulfur cluster assembly factor IBA57 homolog, mitochondrial n=1 Tax=Curvularia kusanoi TaxID=90978 RepID=A0A9P4T8L1_CURKU|nr:ccr4 associated factor [Curvularia kusanoi]